MMKRVLVFSVLFCSACLPLLLHAGQPPMCAMLNGHDLYIASNDGNGTEMCIHFSYCMKNDLYTFARVGARNVSRTTSDPSGIASGTKITWLNVTTSDNIGPVGVKGTAILWAATTVGAAATATAAKAMAM